MTLPTTPPDAQEIEIVARAIDKLIRDSKRFDIAELAIAAIIALDAYRATQGLPESALSTKGSAIMIALTPAEFIAKVKANLPNIKEDAPLKGILEHERLCSSDNIVALVEAYETERSRADRLAEALGWIEERRTVYIQMGDNPVASLYAEIDRLRDLARAALSASAEKDG